MRARNPVRTGGEGGGNRTEELAQSPFLCLLSSAGGGLNWESLRILKQRTVACAYFAPKLALDLAHPKQPMVGDQV